MEMVVNQETQCAIKNIPAFVNCTLYSVYTCTYVSPLYIGIIGETANDEQSTPETKSSTTNEVVAMGDVGTNLLKSIPLTLSVNLECVEGVALLDRRAK